MTFQDDNCVVVSPRLRGGMEMRRARASAAAFVGPLDEYAAGLQLALLPFRGFSAYKGAWARIREGAGNVEADIGYLADGSVNEAAYNAHVAGNDGFMRYWYDQSGGNRSHGRATASQHAQVALNVINGIPVARYNGTTNVSNNGTGGGPALASASGIGRSVYVIFRKRSGPGESSPSRGAFGFLNGSSLRVDRPGATGQLYWNADAYGLEVGLGGDVTDWNIVDMMFDHSALPTATLSIRINGGNASTFFASQSLINIPTTFYLGVHGGAAGSFTDVDVAAALVYNARHNIATRQAIYAILAGRLGLL